MEHVKVERKQDILTIGTSPKLVVNLKSQENYIETEARKIPYRRTIQFSRDLLEGKRQNVFQTAVDYYYRQACEVAEGMKIAEQYREKANRSVREKEKPITHDVP